MAMRKSPFIVSAATAALLALASAGLVAVPREARAQKVEDGSDKAIGEANTRTVLDLIRRHLKSDDAKVTELRRSQDETICGSVNVKNKDGLYSGERGFVVELPTGFFGRVPDGPELLSVRRGADFEAIEKIRQMYFKLCLD